MEQSIQVLEWQAQAKADDLLRVLGKRFPPGASPDLERSIRQTTDVEQLGRWLDAALDAGTLTAFRHKAGLPGQKAVRDRQTKPDARQAGAKSRRSERRNESVPPLLKLEESFVRVSIT